MPDIALPKPRSTAPVAAPRRRPQLRLRPTLLALLGWLACAGGIGVATEAYLSAARRGAQAGMAAEAQATAAALEQNLLRVVEVVRGQFALLESRERMLAEHEAAAAHGVGQHLERGVAVSRFGLVAASVVGLDGVIRYGTVPGLEGLDVGNHATIAAHLHQGERGLLVGHPVHGGPIGRWVVLVTRPLLDAAGKVRDIGAILLDPLALGADLAMQVPQPGRIAILRHLGDGTILARSRDAERDLGHPASPDHPVVPAARAAAAGTTTYRSERDGRLVLTAWRVPEGLPLVVGAVFDTETELAGLRTHQLAAVTAAILLGLFALALALALGGWVEAQQERTALAETLAQQRRDILATLAHEIRTPLTGMLGFSELLAEAQLPPDQARQAATVVESGQVLLALLNDILDLAKLEAGKISLERLPFRPAEVMAGAADLARNAARAKGLALSAQLPPDLPDWAEGDATRLRQILGNLLSNAVKFTPAGFVTLAARVEERRVDGGVILALEVRDTGIAPEAIPRLFGLFEQADASISRHYGGTGLGLAICRRLAEAMGGGIVVESRPGEGSCFRLRLPLGPAAAPTQAAEPPPASPERPLSVLVADDTRANLALVQAYLGSAGHRTSTAATGVEAVAAAQGQRFDVILLDLNMPELDGPAAARHIRNGTGPNRDTPILALTAGTSEEDRAQVRAAGMDAYLTKPIGKAALLRALSAAVRARGTVAEGLPRIEA